MKTKRSKIVYFRTTPENFKLLEKEAEKFKRSKSDTMHIILDQFLRGGNKYDH